MRKKTYTRLAMIPIIEKMILKDHYDSTAKAAQSLNVGVRQVQRALDPSYPLIPRKMLKELGYEQNPITYSEIPKDIT